MRFFLPTCIARVGCLCAAAVRAGRLSLVASGVFAVGDQDQHPAAALLFSSILFAAEQAHALSDGHGQIGPAHRHLLGIEAVQVEPNGALVCGEGRYTMISGEGKGHG